MPIRHSREPPPLIPASGEPTSEFQILAARPSPLPRRLALRAGGWHTVGRVLGVSVSTVKRAVRAGRKVVMKRGGS